MPVTNDLDTIKLNDDNNSNNNSENNNKERKPIFLYNEIEYYFLYLFVYQFVLKKNNKKNNETVNYVKNEIESILTFTVIIYPVVAEKVILETK